MMLATFEGYAAVLTESQAWVAFVPPEWREMNRAEVWQNAVPRSEREFGLLFPGLQLPKAARQGSPST
jgi:hypothetical protein